MKKSIAIMIVLVVLMLCGCAEYTVGTTENPNGESMFVLVEEIYTFAVVYHRDTKVMYVISCGSSNYGNFCLLVNPDGTPMLWEGGENE